MWALEAHGASALLHELMTARSDDLAAREQPRGQQAAGAAVLPERGHTTAYETLLLILRALGLDLKEI